MFLCAGPPGLHAQPAHGDAPDMQVPGIAPAALVSLVARREKLLLFDVRSYDEYAVSHLSNARRIAVETEFDRARFLARLSRNLKGTVVVFYCTSATRSADFALSVMHDLGERGAASVHVLRGGILAWHNEGRPLVDRRGATSYVHPFNEEMKEHMRRPELARVKLQ